MQAIEFLITETDLIAKDYEKRNDEISKKHRHYKCQNHKVINQKLITNNIGYADYMALTAETSEELVIDLKRILKQRTEKKTAANNKSSRAHLMIRIIAVHSDCQSTLDIFDICGKEHIAPPLIGPPQYNYAAEHSIHEAINRDYMCMFTLLRSKFAGNFQSFGQSKLKKFFENFVTNPANVLVAAHMRISQPNDIINKGTIVHLTDIVKKREVLKRTARRTSLS